MSKSKRCTMRARLKGANPKPPIKPSTLESAEQDIEEPKGKERGQRIEIHKEIVVPPETTPPAGSRFKGFEDFTV